MDSSKKHMETERKKDFWRRAAESWWLGPAIHIGSVVGGYLISAGLISAFGLEAGRIVIVVLVLVAATALALPFIVIVQLTERKWKLALATTACSCVALAPVLLHMLLE